LPIIQCNTGPALMQVHFDPRLRHKASSWKFGAVTFMTLP